MAQRNFSDFLHDVLWDYKGRKVTEPDFLEKIKNCFGDIHKKVFKLAQNQTL